jgi:CRISPR/Cas system-associated endonuclease Cas1
MEPLRVPAVDRWVVQICNEQRVSPADFVAAEKGGVRLNAKVFPVMLVDWENDWVGAEHEKALNGVLEELCRRFRQAGEVPPTPGDTP